MKLIVAAMIVALAANSSVADSKLFSSSIVGLITAGRLVKLPACITFLIMSTLVPAVVASVIVAAVPVVFCVPTMFQPVISLITNPTALPR